jgi:hypothetical protein
MTENGNNYDCVTFMAPSTLKHAVEHLSFKSSALPYLFDVWKERAIHSYVRLRICEISSSHGGDYDVQNCLLGSTAM